MGIAIKPRRIEFRDFDAALAEADRLLAGGYEKAGSWDLTQICHHLADAMRLSVTGGVRPMVPLPVRWFLKWRYFDKVARTGRLPSGVKAPEEVRSPPSGDPASAVRKLREAVQRLEAHTGEFSPHPYFGRLSREQARRFHLIHCAHHFGFLVPVG